MITDSPISSRGAAGGNGVAILLLVMVCLALQVCGNWAQEWLSYDRAALASGQWWRLLSGNFLHLGFHHLMLNLLGLVVLVLLCPQPLPLREWLRRLVCLSIGVTAGLYLLAPQWTQYVGLSGVLHGLFLLGLLPQALRRDRIAIVCLLYLAGKLGWEWVMGVPVSDEQAIGGRVVLEAHLFGTLTAIVYGLAFGIFVQPDDKATAGRP